MTTKLVVDGVVVNMLDETKPAGISRTSWANLAIQIGIAHCSFVLEERAYRNLMWH